ncbi:hypothetical protein B0T25DRAFT_598060 [Lasiosphaeria hispida]|uniref:Uncharacterized protein n=1 Tax=Lasiosphaeria hispida TaxID=260671 RepID=A0AAJ0MKV0_9PEZI|nr:hypothetical protein B0T25DRAFT_598060 [Lasiosphaeria hispida]
MHVQFEDIMLRPKQGRQGKDLQLTGNMAVHIATRIWATCQRDREMLHIQRREEELRQRHEALEAQNQLRIQQNQARELRQQRRQSRAQDRDHGAREERRQIVAQQVRRIDRAQRQTVEQLQQLLNEERHLRQALERELCEPVRTRRKVLGSNELRRVTEISEVGGLLERRARELMLSNDTLVPANRLCLNRTECLLDGMSNG